MDEVKDKNILVKIYFYLCKEVTGGLLEEWADLLQVGAVGHVLELGQSFMLGMKGQAPLLRTAGQPFLDSFAPDLA